MVKSILAVTFAALLVTLGSHAVAGETTTPAGAAAAQKIDLNRASLEDLVAIPGIGPRMAQAIVELRTSKGGFTAFEELLQVRGIKEKTLKAITPYFAALTKPAAPPPSR